MPNLDGTATAAETGEQLTRIFAIFRPPFREDDERWPVLLREYGALMAKRTPFSLRLGADYIIAKRRDKSIPLPGEIFDAIDEAVRLHQAQNRPRLANPNRPAAKIRAHHPFRYEPDDWAPRDLTDAEVHDIANSENGVTALREGWFNSMLLTLTTGEIRYPEEADVHWFRAEHRLAFNAYRSIEKSTTPLDAMLRNLYAVMCLKEEKFQKLYLGFVPT